MVTMSWLVLMVLVNNKDPMFLSDVQVKTKV